VTLPLSVLTLALLFLFTCYLIQHFSDYKPIAKGLLLASLVLIVEYQPQRLWALLNAEMLIAWAVIVK